MKTIYKYQLNIVDVQYLQIPRNPEFLSVQWQWDGPVVWALVSPSDPKKSHAIHIYGTSNPIGPYELSGLRYLGTVQSDTQPVTVWHVFVQEEDQ